MKRKTANIQGLIEMKREFNRIKGHPKVHWTLCFYACELIRCFFPLSPSDRSTPWRRWCWPLETQVKNTTFSLSFSLSERQMWELISLLFFLHQHCPTCFSQLCPSWQWVASCFWSPTCRCGSHVTAATKTLQTLFGKQAMFGTLLLLW